MPSLLPYLLLDVLAISTVILLVHRRLSLWHPLTIYLFFHAYSFTFRAYNIFNGAPTIYQGWVVPAEDVTDAEIIRAMLLADFALIVFAAASMFAHHQFAARAQLPVRRRILNPKIVKGVAFVCLPVGLVFFTIFKSVGIDEAGGYAKGVALWPIGVTCMLIYAFGFRWYLVALISIVLSIVALQGYHRFMLVLPLLFLMTLYLQRRRLRWPTVPILLAAIIVGLIFPRLKYIGSAFQAGDMQEMRSQLLQSFVKDKSQDAAEIAESFLDQYAVGLTLIDYNGRKFWGSTYLGMITLPIPREWWPGKPALNEHVQEISTATRQFGREGRIITYLGESYANFGYAGFVVIPALLGYALTAFCLQATSGPWQRLSSYAYLVYFMAFVQLFRDGLYSLVVFTIAHNIPFLILCIIHLLPGYGIMSLDPPPAAGSEKPAR